MRGENKMKGFLFITGIMGLGFFLDAVNAEIISPLWTLPFFPIGIVAFLYLLREVDAL